MTQGIAGSSQNKCLLCRVLKLDSRYRQIKYKKLTKKQPQVQYTTLNKKLKNIEDQDNESTSSSSKDHEETHAKRKLPRQNEVKSRKREKIHTTSSENEVMERSHPEETANEKNDDSSDYSQSKCSLQKHFKCDKSYLPGNPFHYRFINTALNENKKKVLQTKMKCRLRKIRKEHYRLTDRKRILMVGREKKYPALSVAVLSMD